MTNRSDNTARAAAILFLPACAGVIGGELGTTGNGINIWDKAEHFTAYFVLAILVTLALKARGLWLWALLGLVALGGLLEIVQGLIGRDCDIDDAITNSIGVAAGGLLAWLIMAALVRLERRD